MLPTGKTVATRHIISYAVAKSDQFAGDSSQSRKLQQKILHISPLLEAFGNAKTCRNDNSSRFGKLVEIYVNVRSNQIQGAEIVHYLLEKSRVVKCEPGERNYHIFYALVHAARANSGLQQLTKLRASSARSNAYSYLTAEEDDSDAGRFKDVDCILESIGITEEGREEVWKLLAAILHLGNIGFQENAASGVCDVMDEEALHNAATLLGIEEASLKVRLSQRKVMETMKSLSVEECRDARDALAKALYGSLFDWLVAHMNEALGQTRDSASEAVPTDARSLSVLDIFGFESFEKNSFEQLCINYCNEKLHSFFLEEIVVGEMAVYKAEGISFPKIEFTNRGIVDTLENRGGVFSLLDEQTRIVRGSDDAFLNRIKHLSIAMSAAEHDANTLSFPSPKEVRKGASQTAFTLKHYAGPVAYDAEKFLSKNRDALGQDLIDIAHSTVSPFVRDLLVPYETSQSARKTVAGQFRSQLRVLFEKLSSAKQHYIRTILPNDNKAADDFQQEKVLQQLAYSGLLAVCKVRKLGFPFRQTYDSFFDDFSCLVGHSAASTTELIDRLVAKQVLDDKAFARGKTSLFLRAEASAELQSQRKELIAASAKRIQKVARGYQARMSFSIIQSALELFRKVVADVEVDAVEDSIKLFPTGVSGGVVQLVLKELAAVENVIMLKLVLGSSMVEEEQCMAVKTLRSKLQRRSDVFETLETALEEGALEKVNAVLTTQADVLESTTLSERASAFVEEEERKIQERLKKEEELRRKKKEEEEELKRIKKKEEEELKRKLKLEEEERRRLRLEEEKRRLVEEEAKRRRELEEAARLRKRLSEQEKRSARFVIAAESEMEAKNEDEAERDEREEDKAKAALMEPEDDDEIEIIQPAEVAAEVSLERVPPTRAVEATNGVITRNNSSDTSADDSETRSTSTNASDQSQKGAESTMDRFLKPVKVLKARRKLRKALRVNEIIMLTTAIQYCKEHQITKEQSLLPLIQETKSAIMEIMRQHNEQMRREQMLKRKLAAKTIMVDNVPLVR